MSGHLRSGRGGRAVIRKELLVKVVKIEDYSNKKVPIYDWCEKNIKSKKDVENGESENMNKKADVDTGNSEADDGLSRTKIQFERDVTTETSRSNNNWSEGNIKDEDSNSDDSNSDIYNQDKVKKEKILDPELETFPLIKTEELILKSEDECSSESDDGSSRGKIKVARDVNTQSSRSDCNRWEGDIKVDEDEDTSSDDPNSHIDNQDNLKQEKILDLEGEIFSAIKMEELILKSEKKHSKTRNDEQAVLKTSGYVRDREEKKTEKFHCKYGDFETTDELSLKMHVKFHHEKYHCNYGDFETTDELFLKMHVEFHHERIHRTRFDKNIVCDHCNFKTTTDSYLKKHVKKMHGSRATKIYHCDNCQFVAKNNLILKRHVKSIHSA